MTPIEIIRAKMVDMNRQRAELKLESEALGKMNPLVVSVDVVTAHRQRVAQIAGYVAALEFALETLGEKI
jgi:hypothetical protein